MSATAIGSAAASGPRWSLRGASVWRRYGFAWVTGLLFLVSLAGHWALAWQAYKQQQQEHGAPVEVSGYLAEVGRATLENWQSEFLQLLWQVAGLSFLFYVGSNQSRESDERLEAKLDALLRLVNRPEAERIIQGLDEDFARD